MGYFSSQNVDATGKQAVKLQKGIFITLVCSTIHVTFK